jgi:hypothetical protein
VKKITRLILAFVTVPVMILIYPADGAEELRHLPVKEVSVFKDGHAFLVREGRMPANRNGEVMLEDVPAPVMGTFWAYSTDSKRKLASVVAGQHRATLDRTALNIRELLEANTGGGVVVTLTNGMNHTGTILGFPVRTPEELAATSPPHSPQRLSEKSSLLMLQTSEGTRLIPVESIHGLTFKNEMKPKMREEQLRNSLKLTFDSKPGADAAIGLVYLQRGIRWIPSYKVDLDGKGNAVVRLQATLLNELLDLDGTTVQLVIGVPSFYFKETVDPISLQQTLAQLSAFFQDGTGRGRGSALGQAFLSNAMMSQSARMGDYRQDSGGEPAAAGPDIESSKNEDLYVFTLRNVRLKKGERAIHTLAEVTVPYTDVFTMELPFLPPPDVRQHLNNQQQSELAKLFNAPKVTHKARLQNKGTAPFTTAPALIMREGRILSQGMMTYTAAGASVDLAITTAVDVQVKKSETETQRTPNAFSHSGSSYMRVDLAGKIRLTNHRAKAVRLEVTRHALGHIDTADNGGKIAMNNVFESTEHLPVGDDSQPYWWNWYSWPYWWHHVNGVGNVTWNLSLEPGKAVELGYTWHYFWR